MSTITTIQEAIEERAKIKLDRDIDKLTEAYWQFLRDQDLTSNISIKIMAKDGTTSHPYISQLFQAEAVLTQIKEKYLPSYIRAEISAILNNPK